MFIATKHAHKYTDQFIFFFLIFRLVFSTAKLVDGIQCFTIEWISSDWKKNVKKRSLIIRKAECYFFPSIIDFILCLCYIESFNLTYVHCDTLWYIGTQLCCIGTWSDYFVPMYTRSLAPSAQSNTHTHTPKGVLFFFSVLKIEFLCLQLFSTRLVCIVRLDIACQIKCDTHTYRDRCMLTNCWFQLARRFVTIAQSNIGLVFFFFLCVELH